MTNKAFSSITEKQQQRGCDAFGCGSFGASRGNRKHSGVDIVTVPGQKIISPISGTITRYPFPYKGDFNYKGIEIVNDTYLVKIFYVVATVKIGTKVKQGDAIATSQNIAAKYGNGMTNHAHIEVYDKKTNKLLDVSKLF